MSANSKIEWCDATWNPVTGCTKVSPGCDHCYAETFAERWRGTPGHYFERGFDVQLRPDKLNMPLHWRKPRHVFVNSMSDLFHKDVPDEYIARVFAVMAESPRHTYQVLTKRHARMRSLLSSAEWPNLLQAARDNLHSAWDDRWDDDPVPDAFATVLPNVWLGITAENQQWADIRIPALLDTPAAVRMVSAEPLLGPIKLPEHHPWHYTEFGVLCACGEAMRDERCPRQIDWLIVGGESGRGARPMNPEWATDLRDYCTEHRVPFFFKQWGEWVTEDQSPEDITLPGKSTQWFSTNGPSLYRVGKRAAGRMLDGRTHDGLPA